MTLLFVVCCQWLLQVSPLDVNHWQTQHTAYCHLLLSAACFWRFLVWGLACICCFSFSCFWHRIHDLAEAIALAVKSVKYSQANSRSCHAVSCIITNAFMTALSLISFGWAEIKVRSRSYHNYLSIISGHFSILLGCMIHHILVYRLISDWNTDWSASFFTVHHSLLLSS
jgi:hypothetical protein